MFAKEYFHPFNPTPLKNKPLILVGPSGVGKRTLIDLVLQDYGDIFARKKSVTTRPIRVGNEKSKENFNFVTKHDFQAMVQRGEFIEYRERSEDCFYGTSKAELERIKADGKIPIIEVQTNGSLLESLYVEELGENYVQIAPGRTNLNILKQWGVTAIAISIASPGRERNSKIMGLPTDFNYLTTAKAVSDAGLLTRISLNLTKEFRVEELNGLTAWMKWNGIHQLTLRELGIPEVGKSNKISKWIKENTISRSELCLLGELLQSDGTKLRPLPHGGWVYDLNGLGVVLTTCMTDTQADEVRSLILQPDGHIYHSWNHQGSIIL